MYISASFFVVATGALALSLQSPQSRGSSAQVQVAQQGGSKNVLEHLSRWSFEAAKDPFAFEAAYERNLFELIEGKSSEALAERVVDIAGEVLRGSAAPPFEEMEILVDTYSGKARRDESLKSSESSLISLFMRGMTVLEWTSFSSGIERAVLTTESLVLSLNSGTGQLVVGEDVMAAKKGLFDVGRMRYPLGIDAASPQWKSAEVWESRRGDDYLWLQFTPPEAPQMRLTVVVDKESNLPRASLLCEENCTLPFLVLTIYRKSEGAESDSVFDFESIRFDMLALPKSVNVEHIRCRRLPVPKGALMLPVDFERSPTLKDLRKDQRRAYDADVSSWPEEIVAMLTPTAK